VKVVYESPAVQKKGFVRKFWILKNKSKVQIHDGTMIVKKSGEAVDFKPQTLDKVEPGQTFKVQVKFAVVGSGNHKANF
jgi:hypothetical protein